MKAFWKYVKRMEAWEWMGVGAGLAMLFVIVILFFGLEKKEQPNSEVVDQKLNLSGCQVRSVIWFNDKGQSVAAKALVCDEKEK